MSAYDYGLELYIEGGETFYVLMPREMRADEWLLAAVAENRIVYAATVDRGTPTVAIPASRIIRAKVVSTGAGLP